MPDRLRFPPSRSAGLAASRAAHGLAIALLSAGLAACTTAPDATAPAAAPAADAPDVAPGPTAGPAGAPATSASSGATAGDTVPTEQVAAYAAPALVATPRGDQVTVYADVAGRTPLTTLSNPTPGGGPLVLAVLAEGGERHRVALPVRPNGSAGWVDADQVTLAVTPYRVVVELGAHALTVYRSGRVVLREPIGVGVAPTPTPGGRFYLYELIRPHEPAGAYGPYAFGLSGFSETITEFAGGDGRLGIHGTNDPSSIGADATQGCIRLMNDAITELAALLPLGTPVEIAP